ncbi:MAG: hypothetical protein K2X87_12770 [Gemmataceae bacterium]|nr:hypothetical protein [Gemmataceae bacterium]
MVRRSSVLRTGVFLFLAAGFAAAADPFPVAPPPREKPAKPKINPSLLVGKWQLVHQNFRTVPPGEISTREYTKGGRYRFETRTPGEPPWSQDGAYAVEEDALTLQSDMAEEGFNRTRTVTIEVLTPDRLVVTIKGQQSVYVRVLAK